MGKIGIIGAGVFGTALALTATRAGNNVLCYARNPETVDNINKNHTNPKYLPHIPLSDKICATSRLKDIFDDTNTILLTTTAQATREILKQITPYIRKDTIIVFCAKGIEAQSGKLLSEIAKEEIPNATIAVLSGPGFAIDIAQKKFVSVTIACPQKDIAEQLTQALGTPYFRPYIDRKSVV